MSLAASYARTYALHCGLEASGIDAEMSARLGRLPWWGRLGAQVSAAYACWAAPLLLLGRASTFAGLGDDERERLLTRLQAGHGVVARALFLPLKSVVLGAVYGPRGLRL